MATIFLHIGRRRTAWISCGDLAGRVGVVMDVGFAAVLAVSVVVREMSVLDVSVAMLVSM
jgi:hypothetical protein